MNTALLKELSMYSVVYAEDDEGVRANVAEMLSLLFKKVYVAHDGKEAYELYRQYHPELIITDIKMPNMGGIELARKIREENKDIQILMVSAHTEVDYMLEAVELSLVRYIVKPITEIKLFEALERFLSIQNSSGLIPLSQGWVYDSSKKCTILEGKEFELTKKESKLLELLLKKEGVLSYEEIEAQLWEEEYMSLNALRLLMKNFRKKLPKGSLKNIQSIGYKL